MWDVDAMEIEAAVLLFVAGYEEKEQKKTETAGFMPPHNAAPRGVVPSLPSCAKQRIKQRTGRREGKTTARLLLLPVDMVTRAAYWRARAKLLLLRFLST